jgi:hypothetical protein
MMAHHRGDWATWVIDVYFDDQDECVVGVGERTTVFKIRNGGNFDFGAKQWLPAAGQPLQPAG